MKQGDLFGFDDVVAQENQEKKYSKKIDTPIYTPRQRNVSLYECYDHQKYLRLCRRIDNTTTLSEHEKSFLKLAASRFIVFNYESIADYYAEKANKEMQGIMEELALVIIDFDKAIENGFIQLNDETRVIYEQEIG